MEVRSRVFSKTVELSVWLAFMSSCLHSFKIILRRRKSSFIMAVTPNKPDPIGQYNYIILLYQNIEINKFLI